MGKDRLEEYIKDQIHDHRSEVNPDAIWAAIQPPAKKKRKPFWLLGLFGIFLVSAIVVYNLWDGNSNKLSDQQINKAQKQIVDATKEELKSTPISQHQEEETLANTAINTETNTTPNSLKSSTSTIKENNTPSVESSPISVATQKPLTTKPQQIINKVPQDIKPRTSENNSAQAKANISAQKDILKESTFSNNRPIAARNSDAKKKVESNAQASLVPLSITLLENQKHSLKFSRSIQPEFLTLPTIVMPLETLKEEKPSPWHLSGSYAYFKGARDLSSDTLNIALLESRNTHEEFMEAWELAALVGYTHSSGLRLETGISYTQINDRTIVPLVEERFLYPVPTSFDRAIYKELTTVNQHRFHKIKMIDVPLLLSYGMTQGKWSIRPGAGLNINLMTSGTGNISGLGNGNSVLVDVSTLNTFESRIGYNLEARLQLDYHISDKLSLNLSSSYKHYPNSFAQGSIQQKYKLWGLRVGLSRTF